MFYYPSPMPAHNQPTPEPRPDPSELPAQPPEAAAPPPEAPSELAAHEGTRPDMAQPRPLRTPSSPQREHIIAEAEALRRYVEEGGPVDYFRTNRPGGRKRVGFVVERARFNRIRAQIRAEQTGNRPWIWHPKRGLHRSST